MGELATALSETADRITSVLDRLIPEEAAPERQVVDAMRYGTLGGGKRLRPFLAAQAAALFETPEDRALRVGAAIEMIHCYSLVHDDLPAMDDDDLRRDPPGRKGACDARAGPRSGSRGGGYGRWPDG